jgi:MFS transporter, ACS family, solute carrier family 17 (sodium-dependent inorganic phosphate cotransporter), other
MSVSLVRASHLPRAFLLRLTVSVWTVLSQHHQLSAAFAPRSHARINTQRCSAGSRRKWSLSSRRHWPRLRRLDASNGKAALSVHGASSLTRSSFPPGRSVPNNSTNGFYSSKMKTSNGKAEENEALYTTSERRWESWYYSQGRTRFSRTIQQPLVALSKDDMLTHPSAIATQKNQMLALLWLIACVSALDRVAMSIALLPMGAEFGLTDTVKGSLSSYFSLGYGLGIVPAGLLISQCSPKVVMSGGLALWSLATLATPLATTAGTSFSDFPLHLLLVRAAVGMGESVILPAVQRLLSQWTTIEEKAGALAVVISGFHAGTLAAYVLSPIILEQTHNWRGLFDAYGGVGILLLLPWWLIARDSPQEQAKGSDQTASSASSSTAGKLWLSSVASPFDVRWTTPAPTAVNAWQSSWDSAVRTFRDAPWNELLNSKAAWALLLAHCAKNWGLYNALAWTPTFYAEQYDLNVRDSAMLSVLPSVIGAICVVMAGSMADFLGKQLDKSLDPEDGKDVRGFVRKAFQAAAFGGQGLALAALASHIPEQAAVAQAFLVATYAFTAFNAAGFESGIQDKAGERWAGLLYSVTSLPAVLVGSAGVYVTGRILDVTNQDWSYVYGLNSIICFLGAAAFFGLYDSKKEFD